MKRPHERRRLEPDASPASPWLEAALRATDPTAFLMSLSETEFGVLLAELDAKRRAAVATGPRAATAGTGEGSGIRSRARGNGVGRSSG